MNLGVVTDERISLRNGRVVSRVPLTGPFLELLADPNNIVHFLSRPWEGNGGAEIQCAAHVEVSQLPDWTLLRALTVAPRLFGATKIWLRDRGALLIVLPSLAGIVAGLLMVRSTKLGGVPIANGFVTVNRSFGGDSILLRFGAFKRALLRPMLKLADRAYESINKHGIAAIFVSEALARAYGKRNAVIAPEIDWGAIKAIRADGGRLDRILFIGRLEVEKNPFLALEAFAAADLTNFELCFIGDGSMRSKLSHAVQQRGIKGVTFAGLVSHKEVLEFMSTSQVVLVPSRTEAFGLVAFEAIASGAHVLHSGRGGLPEAVGTSSLAHAEGSLTVHAWATCIRTITETIRTRPRAALPDVASIRRSNDWTTLREVLDDTFNSLACEPKRLAD